MKAILALAAVTALGGEAALANEIFAAEPKTVVTTIQALGYRATLAREGTSTRVDSAIAGLNYVIDFYGCDDAGAACQFLEFTARFTVDPPAKPDTIALWNSDNLFGTAYLDDEGLANISYTVTTVGGLTAANFTDVLARWEVTLDNFSKAIGY